MGYIVLSCIFEYVGSIELYKINVNKKEIIIIIFVSIVFFIRKNLKLDIYYILFFIKKMLCLIMNI